jgi:photosystem II stability/assembly factor-like uncharacterized protein
MKLSSFKTFSILTTVILISTACGLSSTATPSPKVTTVAVPTALPATLAPTPEVLSPTIESIEPTSTVETSAEQPVSRPAAPAHFKAGDPIKIERLVMKSRADGWGLSGPYLLATSDGAKTWREATPPETLPQGAASFASGAALNASTAWVIFLSDAHISPEAVIWHTTDGGRNWTPSPPLNHQVIGDKVWAQFAVWDAQNVWMMVRGVYVGAGTHYNHQLFRTTDGGLTWNSLDGQTSDNYSGMVFADSNFGLRTLQTTGAYAPAPPAYDVTTDGGVTWQTRELPPPPGSPDLFTQYPYCETFQPVLVSAQSLRMLMGCFDYENPPKKFVSYFYSSQDSGSTWQSVLLASKVQAAQDQLIYFGLNNGLLLGHDIYISTSDGQTWTRNTAGLSPTRTGKLPWSIQSTGRLPGK